jgi:hypothetical protein
MRNARASVEHVAHEGGGGGGARSVNDVGDAGGKRRGHGVGDDGSRGGPGEDFNLPGRVEEDVAVLNVDGGQREKAGEQ